MHNTRIFWLLLFSLCVIRQVSSRKCYVCESSADEPCFNVVNRDDFQYDCVKIITHYLKTIDNSFEYLQAFIKEYSKDYKPGIVDNFDCVTIRGVKVGTLGEEKIIRGCIPKSRNCSDFEAPLIFSGLLTESCESCDTNLCNSHPQTKVPRPTHNTESYTETTMIISETPTKSTTIDTKHSSLLHRDNESHVKLSTVEAKRLPSLAKIMQFDYQIGFWYGTISLVWTFL